MSERTLKVKKLLLKLRELRNLDNLPERVQRTMGRLHDPKISLLRPVEEKFVHYDNLKNLQQEESEERKLLQGAVHIVLREKRYMNFMMKILKRFDSGLLCIQDSISGYRSHDFLHPRGRYYHLKLRRRGTLWKNIGTLCIICLHI